MSSGQQWTDSQTVHALAVTEHPASLLLDELPLEPEAEPEALPLELVPPPELSLPELPFPVLPSLAAEPESLGVEVPVPPQAAAEVAVVMMSHVTLALEKFI